MRLLLIPASILCSAFAQVALRQAGRHEQFIGPWVYWILASVAAYGFSFLTYAVLLKWYPISRISPLLTVGVMLAVVGAGAVLGESLGTRQWMGIAFGVIAIILITTR